MGVLNNLLEDSKLIPQTFEYKLDNDLLTIEDQQEALTKPRWSYYFAKTNIPGSNVKALQTKACEEPCYACLFMEQVRNIADKFVKEHNGSSK